MAKKESVTKPGNNGYDPEKLEQYLKAFEKQDEVAASIMGTARAECNTPRKKQKDLLNDAKTDGFQKSLMRGLLKVRKHDREANKVREDMDANDQDEFDKMCQAIGGLLDTPLGQAAVDAAS